MLSLILLFACKDDAPADDSAPGAPTFADMQHIFDRSCNTYGCHAGAEAETGLDLSAGVSYAMLIDAPSAQLASMARVTPGASEDSYLVHKLDGTHVEAGGSGDAMPPDLPFGLDPGEIDRVRAWIDAGAAP